MTDKLIEAVARGIWDRPVGHKRVPYDLLDMEDQDVFRAYARAAVAAIEASGSHRVVPVEATDEMQGDAWEAYESYNGMDEVWRVFLAAAPKVIE